MNPDIEKILLAQAAKKQNRTTLSDAIAVGRWRCSNGALVGAVPQGLVRCSAQAKNTWSTTNTWHSHGWRSDWSILGGGLGAAFSVAISEPSGAGALLAKIQAQGGISPEDEANLEWPRKAYSEQGIL